MSVSRSVASQAQILFDSGTSSGLPEWLLLDRFARFGDQAAFEALVARHGPMVMGVCRRVLGDGPDADDAFQATFLVLIRRARDLGPDDVLAAWLHGVASRVAIRARADRQRRRARERPGAGVEFEPAATVHVPPDFTLLAVLDEELERLPWKYRAPIALCHLEGLTHEEAARRLEWPIGSVKGRLARARSLLATRLSRRGVTPAVGAATGAVALEGLARAAVSDPLRGVVARTAARITEGHAWQSVVTTSVAHLTRGVVASMIISKLKLVASLAAALALMTTSADVAARQPVDAPESNPIVATASPAPDPLASNPSPALNLAPEDRLLSTARQAFETALDDFRQRPASLDRVYRMSRLLLDSEKDKARDDEAVRAAFADHLDRMRRAARVDFADRRDVGVGGDPIIAEARAVVAEAELMLARGAAPSPPSASAAATEERGGSTKPQGDRSPRTAAILKKLDEPLPMNFPNETPFEDILKYIKQATQGPDDVGIPIYVDPLGLSEADRTMTSPISLDLDQVPLKRTLQLMLKQIGLIYIVEDGMIYITSADSTDITLGPVSPEPTPLLQDVERASRGAMSQAEMETLTERLSQIAKIRSLYATVTEPPPPDGGAVGASHP